MLITYVYIVLTNFGNHTDVEFKQPAEQQSERE